MFCLPVPHDKFEVPTPWAIYGIAFVDLLLLVPVLDGDPGFIARYGFVAAHPTVLTFFTAIFLHIGIWHYVGNMFFFWMFGRKIEATLGHLTFLLAFLLSGVGGQLLYWALDLHAAVPCVGASGAISGIAGLYLVMYPMDRFDLHLYLGWWRVKTIESDARVAVSVWIAEQFVLGVIAAFGVLSTVAFWAHVGGFATGAALGALYRVQIPQEKRPSFTAIEVPLIAEVEQPNPLVGLNLAPTSATLAMPVVGEEPARPPL